MDLDRYQQILNRLAVWRIARQPEDHTPDLTDTHQLETITIDRYRLPEQCRHCDRVEPGGCQQSFRRQSETWQVWCYTCQATWHSRSLNDAANSKAQGT